MTIFFGCPPDARFGCPPDARFGCPPDALITVAAAAGCTHQHRLPVPSLLRLARKIPLGPLARLHASLAPICSCNLFAVGTELIYSDGRRQAIQQRQAVCRALWHAASHSVWTINKFLYYICSAVVPCGNRCQCWLAVCWRARSDTDRFSRSSAAAARRY